MGYVKQSWKVRQWNNPNPESTLQRLIEYQERNFPLYGRRPVGQLSLRVRDYISINPKTSTVSAYRLQALFKEIHRILKYGIVEFLNSIGAIKDGGFLNERVAEKDLKSELQKFRIQMPSSLANRIANEFLIIRDGLSEWDILIPLFEVNVMNGSPLPELNQVRFLTADEAQQYHDSNLINDPSFRLDFSSVKGAALVSRIRARDSIRATEIASNKLLKTLDLVLFLDPSGHFKNPKLRDVKAFCVETTVTHKRMNWLTRLEANQIEDEFFLRHPNSVDNENKRLEELLRFTGTLKRGSLGMKVAKAIYWYRKGNWAGTTENRLLNHWISLETLLSTPSKDKIKFVSNRTGLLTPTVVNIDEDYTYEQLRNWTSEFVDDVYYLRNEIVHGGTFEGPSFDRFVERLDSYLKRAILIVLVALTSKTCIPDDIDELLAWIWYKNPDKKIADARKT